MILSIDPGTKNLGYAIMARNMTLLEYDNIDISRDPLTQLCAFVSSAISRFAIDHILVEWQLSWHNIKTSQIEHWVMAIAEVNKIKHTWVSNAIKTENKKKLNYIQRKKYVMDKVLEWYPSVKTFDQADAIYQCIKYFETIKEWA